ncbi:MAG: flavin reductase family protein [Candidatus Hadarchaeales archaeon]
MKVEVPGRRVYRLLYPRQVVLVTCMGERGPNIIPIAWSIPLSFEPPLVGISVSPKRYSHGLILRSKEFVINIPTQGLLKEVMETGSCSGEHVDKFSTCGLTAAPAKRVKAPIISECIAHIECRLREALELGDHTLFVGEVLAAYSDPAYFNGESYTKEGDLLYQLAGEVFITPGRRVKYDAVR